MQKSINVENIDNNITIISLNRPKSLNALNADLANELFSSLSNVEHSKNCRCLIIRGNGGHFMAGGDLKSFSTELDNAPDERRKHFELFIGIVHPIIQCIKRMPKPVIASVEGAAGGFGMSLMMACDLVIASDKSFYTMAYSSIGTSPDGSSTWFLPRLVGLKKAMELALLSERFDSTKALDMGLINKVVPSNLLERETLELASKLAEGPTYAYAHTKRLINSSMENHLDSQLQAEAECFSDCASTDDFAEGVSAFIEKRKPKFKGQ
tara:strand:+ start:66 stop:866 length:801 start_codon:yes stop_codon:yes gene_type:complete